MCGVDGEFIWNMKRVSTGHATSKWHVIVMSSDIL